MVGILDDAAVDAWKIPSVADRGLSDRLTRKVWCVGIGRDTLPHAGKDRLDAVR